jgi:threonine dehydratase
MSLPVTYDDVLAALPRVHSVLSPTPLLAWPGLCDQLGFLFYLKHENHQPVGAFKVRGGINLVAGMSAKERQAGILGVSTGNHGQSLAFAAERFHVPCTIVVPQINNPDKIRAIRQRGAKIVEHGRDFEEARQYAEQNLPRRGERYVHSANEPALIAGVATLAWEVFQCLPDPDVILVPVGLGSGVCGACIVAKHLRPQTRIIGVQSSSAPAVARSWRSGQMESTAEAATWAEGLATRHAASMTLDIMRTLMDDVILVSDELLRWAVYQILRHTHNLAEGAGAATFAAAYQCRQAFQGQKVVGILSGGNLDLAELPRILAEGPAEPGG